MTTSLSVAALPFPVEASHPGVWRHDDATGAVVVDALPHTDLYINPAGNDAGDAESMLNAATLLGTPPPGDFQLRARVTVDFASQFDAGVLLIWIDERQWAKVCFEFSPAHEPMVVSVVTRGISDDANAFVVAERSIWLRVSRHDHVYAFHASTDSERWHLIRVFALDGEVGGHQIGFEAQSPKGEGCSVTFTHIHFTPKRLDDLRDGT